jgi:hypothetical protein
MIQNPTPQQGREAGSKRSGISSGNVVSGWLRHADYPTCPPPFATLGRWCSPSIAFVCPCSGSAPGLKPAALRTQYLSIQLVKACSLHMIFFMHLWRLGPGAVVRVKHSLGARACGPESGFYRHTDMWGVDDSECKGDQIYQIPCTVGVLCIRSNE